MKKSFILIFILSLAFSVSKAQKLSFGENGTFKIVQFTDMHYVHGNPKSDTTILNINRVLDAEKPDMVVFTGDVVTGAPVHEGWDAITKLVIDRKIPFAVNLGNHDHEMGVTREEIARFVTAYPYNLNSPQVQGVSGVMNDVIPIYGSKQRLSVEALIYCFDSGAYSNIEGVDGYGWITGSQIEWYKKQSLDYTLKNNVRPLPALAYFHIPLPEYQSAFNDDKNKRFGERFEDECPPKLNSGLFLTMKEMHDVMAMFVGHDHKNDYIVDYYGIALAYGRFSGWKTTYTPEINGARVVVLKENERAFDTWVRLLDGKIKDRATFPSDFKKDDAKK
jgi:3',5'-cyclic AMP phosphodiesterase CpdA